MKVQHVGITRTKDGFRMVGSYEPAPSLDCPTETNLAYPEPEYAEVSTGIEGVLAVLHFWLECEEPTP